VKSFDDAFKFVIGEEGALSMDPTDRGNWDSGKVGVGNLRGTKYGISAMAYPHEDIANLTTDRAKVLYQRDYWDKFQGDALPSMVGLGMFDCAVNEGVEESIKLAQKALGGTADGVFGPSTLARLKMATARWARSFAIERIMAYSTMAYWVQDHDGWVGRILDVHLQMIMVNNRSD